MSESSFDDAWIKRFLESADSEEFDGDCTAGCAARKKEMNEIDTSDAAVERLANRVEDIYPNYAATFRALLEERKNSITHKELLSAAGRVLDDGNTLHWVTRLLQAQEMQRAAKFKALAEKAGAPPHSMMACAQPPEEKK